MSALGVKRRKERGGAGGKVMPAMPNFKPITPLSDKSMALLSSSNSIAGRSTVKEKPRSASRGLAVSQKPAIVPMPRIDRSSAVGSVAGDAEAKRRLSSTSSVPRGRSSSPSDFSRILSDLRRTGVSRVPAEQGKRAPICESGRPDLEKSAVKAGSGKRTSGIRGSERSGSRESSLRANEKSVYGDLKENVNAGGKLVKSCVEAVADSRAVGSENGLRTSLNERPRQSRRSTCDSKVDLSLNAVRCSEKVEISAFGDHSYGNKKERNPKVWRNAVSGDPSAQGPNTAVKSDGDPTDIQKTKSGFRSKVCGVNGSNVVCVEDSQEKPVHAVSVGARAGGKYPGKLHEKLAFLEGKVKRIASDIKRTKDMLDMNNPEASKVIISDIQEKISGIEKAMSNVVGDSDRDSCLSQEADKREEGPIQYKRPDSEKIPVAGLNNDELEARLFPHHKLLRGRSSLKTSSTGFQSNQDHNLMPVLTDKLVGSVDENQIAVEILASLGEQPSKVSEALCRVFEVSEVQETDDSSVSSRQQSSNMLVGKHTTELELTSEERLDEFDDKENESAMMVEGDNNDNLTCQIREIGSKASTGGWFVSEGESVLLVHEDSSCSLHDIANSEVKSEYRPPSGIPSNIWRDCWIIRAPSADGCSGKYVVAASAGNALGSGFCSWDYHTKEVQAFHIDDRSTNNRTVLAPVQENIVRRKSSLSAKMPTENKQWWYKPSGPLVVSTASCQRSVRIFDVRDGEQIMKWDVQKPVLNMDYSSPLQWRSKGKVVIAESDAISIWDVGSMNPQSVLSVSVSVHEISALHVCNTDAEIGGGVRQRISSSEAEGHDGVFCTADFINILDFRQPSGIGHKIPKPGVCGQSIFSRGDSVYLGCNSIRPSGKTSPSQVQQFSLRQQKLVSSYVLPESNAHLHQTSLSQVWGSQNHVMGVCGQGLFVFDAVSGEGLPSFALDFIGPQKPGEVIGSDDLYAPSFDHASSQILLISRDRPAMFRYL